jgi:hypothetical protein
MLDTIAHLNMLAREAGIIEVRYEPNLLVVGAERCLSISAPLAKPT